jgi:hypothetical protein
MLILERLNILAAVFLAYRLWRAGLWRKYLALFCFFCFFALALAVSQAIRRNTNLFAEFYIGSVPLHWIFYGWTVSELFHQTLADYKGIATAGTWAVRVVIALALGASLLSVGLDWHARGQAFPILYFIHLAERIYFTAVALLIVGLLAFLLWFPVQMRRNALVLAAGFGCLFLAKALVLLLRNLAGPQVAIALSAAQHTATLACLASWSFLLSPAGEERKGAARPATDPEQAARLVRQLDRINVALLRTAGR